MSEIKYFQVNTSGLTDKEKTILEYLKQVGLAVHLIWEKQFNETTLEAFFYPRDVERDELLEAAKKDMQLLSPYTVVKRDDKKKLYSVSYRDEYKEEIDTIVELLRKCVKLADGRFKQYLNEIAENYDKGDFNEALLTYVNTEDSKISFLMGPIETHQDRLLSVKRSFQYNLRVLSENNKKLQRMVEITKAGGVLKPISSTASSVDASKIKVKVADVIMFAGRQASSNPSSTNLPNEESYVKKYGTKVVFYQNSMEEKIKRICTVYEDIFPKITLKKRIESLKMAYVQLIALHEISEALVKYDDMSQRLLSTIDMMRELNAFMLALKSAEYYMINGLLTKEELDDIQLCNILYGIDALIRRNLSTSTMEYAKGYAIMFNYAIEKGMMKIEKGKVYIDFNKGSVMTPLVDLIHQIYALGTEKDVQKIVDKYGSFEIFDTIEI